MKQLKSTTQNTSKIKNQHKFNKQTKEKGNKNTITAKNNNTYNTYKWMRHGNFTVKNRRKTNKKSTTKTKIKISTHI